MGVAFRNRVFGCMPKRFGETCHSTSSVLLQARGNCDVTKLRSRVSLSQEVKGTLSVSTKASDNILHSKL